MTPIEKARECAHKIISRLIKMKYCSEDHRALFLGAFEPIISDAIEGDNWIPVSERLPEPHEHVLVSRHERSINKPLPTGPGKAANRPVERDINPEIKIRHDHTASESHGVWRAD